MPLITSYWPIVLVIIVLIFVFRFIMHVVLRIVLAAVLIALVAVYIFHYPPSKVMNIGQHLASQTSTTLKSVVTPVLEKQIKDAKYTFNPDGSYEVRTSDIRIDGKKGDNKAILYYDNHPFNVDISQLGATLQQHIQQGK